MAAEYITSRQEKRSACFLYFSRFVYSIEHAINAEFSKALA